MKKLLFLLLLASTALANETPKIDLKRKSTFTMDSRNPFWPIGWKPAPRTAGSDHAGPTIPAASFLVSSITMGGGPRFAIINGKTMGEGDHFGLQMGSQVYQITVKAIQDGRVILLRHDQEIVVSLRRK